MTKKGVKKGNDALELVRNTINRTLGSTKAGRKFLSEHPNIEQQLTYNVCKRLKLICGYVDDEKSRSGENEWSYGCRREPRAKGLCMKHFQRVYIKYVPRIEKEAKEANQNE